MRNIFFVCTALLSTFCATTCFGSSLPDLVVTSISANPANPTPGQAVTFTATVKNQGGSSTPAGVTIGTAFSIDGNKVSWAGNSTALAPVASGTYTANGGPTGSATWTATAGTHSLQAFVNDVFRFAESNTGNNSLTQSLNVGSSLPDLVVTSISANPANPTPGQAITFTATVKNQGGSSTPAGVTIGTAFSIDGNKVSWAGDGYSTALAPGASGTYTANGGPTGIATWTATPGTHSVQAFVNDLFRFAESKTGNNTLTQTLNVGGSSPNPPPSGQLIGEGPGGTVCSNAGATFYVTAGGGADSGARNGSSAQPFATINYAISRLTTPGQIIQVEPGNYAPFTAGGPAGTSTAHYTLRGDSAFARNQVVIGPTISQVPAGYWDICHITIDGGVINGVCPGGQSCTTDGNHAGLIAFDLSNVNIDDIESRNNWQTGVRIYGAPPGAPASSHIVISNSYIHDNCQEAYNNPTKFYDSGMVFQGVTYSTMRNNLAENNWGEGLNTFASTDFPISSNDTIAYNIVHNSADTGIYLSNSAQGLVTGNFVYMDDARFADGTGYLPEAIKMSDELFNVSADDNAVISNNVTLGGAHGFRYGAYDANEGFRNATIVGNTFVNAADTSIMIDSSGNTTNTNLIADNISINHANGAFSRSTAGITFYHNAWYGNTAGMVAGAGDVTADPLLPVETGAAYNNANSYAPPTYSPVKNAGSANAALTKDFFGATRPYPPSIGAAEPR